MYIRFSSLFPVAAFAALAAAAAVSELQARTGTCLIGTPECCSLVTNSTDPHVAPILELFGIDPTTITGLVGTGCFPTTVTSTITLPCFLTSACCSGTVAAGLISTNCTLG